MRLNFKAIIVGGIIFYAVQWILGMISGIVLHEGVLEPLYKATTEFWRPELTQDPPDMAALMPRWIATGLIMTFIFAGIYDNIPDLWRHGSGLVRRFQPAGKHLGVVGRGRILPLLHQWCSAGLVCRKICFGLTLKELDKKRAKRCPVRHGGQQIS